MRDANASGLTDPSSATAHGGVDADWKMSMTAMSRSLERVVRPYGSNSMAWMVDTGIQTSFLSVLMQTQSLSIDFSLPTYPVGGPLTAPPPVASCRR